MAVDLKAFEAAMTAALKGPERKRLKIERHEFNVKPVEINRDGATITVVGKSGHNISHHRSWVPDDQVLFGFKKQSGVMSDLEMKIDEGGVGALVKKIAKVVEIATVLYDAASGGSDKADAAKAAQDAAFQETKRLLDGSWQGEANFLIANIALRVI